MPLFGDFHANINKWVEDIDFGIRDIDRDIGEAKAFGFPVKPHCLGRRFTQGIDVIGWPAHSNPGWTRTETSEFIPFGQLTLKLNLHINLRLRAGLKPNRKSARLKSLNFYSRRQVHSHVILRQPNDSFARLLIADIDSCHQAGLSNVFEFVWASREDNFHTTWKFITNLNPFLLNKT